MKKSDIDITNRLIKKASKSHCTYKISAIGFDSKGNVLGQAVNKHSSWDVLEKTNNTGGRAGTAKHAERILMSQYGRKLKTILICRVGRSGLIRKIDPCPTCKKVAEKYGIKIISVENV